MSDLIGSNTVNRRSRDETMAFKEGIDISNYDRSRIEGTRSFRRTESMHRRATRPNETETTDENANVTILASNEQKANPQASWNTYEISDMDSDDDCEFELDSDDGGENLNNESIAHPYGPKPENHESPSIGSVNHWNGQCKPCVFFHGKGCKNGSDCLFCHEVHPKRKRIRKISGAKLDRLLERASQRPQAEWAAKVLKKYGHLMQNNPSSHPRPLASNVLSSSSQHSASVMHHPSSQPPPPPPPPPSASTALFNPYSQQQQQFMAYHHSNVAQQIFNPYQTNGLNNFTNNTSISSNPSYTTNKSMSTPGGVNLNSHTPPSSTPAFAAHQPSVSQSGNIASTTNNLPLQSAATFMPNVAANMHHHPISILQQLMTTPPPFQSLHQPSASQQQPLTPALPSSTTAPNSNGITPIQTKGAGGNLNKAPSPVPPPPTYAASPPFSPVVPSSPLSASPPRLATIPRTSSPAANHLYSSAAVAAAYAYQQHALASTTQDPLHAAAALHASQLATNHAIVATAAANAIVASDNLANGVASPTSPAHSGGSHSLLFAHLWRQSPLVHPASQPASPARSQGPDPFESLMRGGGEDIVMTGLDGLLPPSVVKDAQKNESE